MQPLTRNFLPTDPNQSIPHWVPWGKIPKPPIKNPKKSLFEQKTRFAYWKQKIYYYFSGAKLFEAQKPKIFISLAKFFLGPLFGSFLASLAGLVLGTSTESKGIF